MDVVEMLKYSSLELWLLDTDMRTDCLNTACNMVWPREFPIPKNIWIRSVFWHNSSENPTLDSKNYKTYYWYIARI